MNQEILEHTSSPCPKKFKFQPLQGRSSQLFFNINRMLMLAFKDTATTVNARSYRGILHDLHTIIKRKCPGMLLREVIMLHNNACTLLFAVPKTCCTPCAAFIV
jgi:hypothetical protein